MKKKAFWMPLTTSLATIVLLEVIGYLLKFPLLMFISYDGTPTKDYLFTVSYSIVPVIICLIVGILTERKYKTKQKN